MADFIELTNKGNSDKFIVNVSKIKTVSPLGDDYDMDGSFIEGIKVGEVKESYNEVCKILDSSYENVRTIKFIKNN